MPEEHKMRVERVNRFAERTLAVVGVGMVLLAVALFFATWYLQPDVYAPLGPYPEQSVNHTFLVGELPGFRLGDPVRVVGEKCSDETVDVIGSVQWQTVEPAGTFVSAGTGTRTANPGCEIFDFVNEMPPGVIEANEDLFAQGFTAPVWAVTGIETPINPETGENGNPQAWETEPFVIVPRGYTE